MEADQQPFVNEGYATKFDFTYPGCTSKLEKTTCGHRDNATCKHWHIHSKSCPWVTDDYSVLEVKVESYHDDYQTDPDPDPTPVDVTPPMQISHLVDEEGTLTAQGWKAIQKDAYTLYNYAVDHKLEALRVALETMLGTLKEVA